MIDLAVSSFNRPEKEREREFDEIQKKKRLLSNQTRVETDL